jgi:hypothetical protein
MNFGATSRPLAGPFMYCGLKVSGVRMSSALFYIHEPVQLVNKLVNQHQTTNTLQQCIFISFFQLKSGLFIEFFGKHVKIS